MSFLAQSPLILHDADHDLYWQFVRSLLRHASVLRSALSASSQFSVPAISSRKKASRMKLS